MDKNNNIKIFPAFSGWLLLLCCVVGCVCSDDTAMHGRAIPCDPCYGFRPTCWRHWPGCCATGPCQDWIETTADRLPDGEPIPTPPAEPNATGQEPTQHLPQHPRRPIVSPPSTDLWP